jgi:hypothetical protein
MRAAACAYSFKKDRKKEREREKRGTRVREITTWIKSVYGELLT